MKDATHPPLRWSIAVLTSVTMAFTLTMAIVPGTASASAHAVPRVLIPRTAYLGARIEPRAGETQPDAVERVESRIGRTFAIDHFYYQWTSSFPNSATSATVADGRIPFINWKAGGSWASIADGSQDATIVSHADAIESFGYPIYLSFHHEPENDLDTYGTPANYAAAWRHIVDVFRARGVTNVAWVWTMMGWSFNPRSGRDATPTTPGMPTSISSAPTATTGTRRSRDPPGPRSIDLHRHQHFRCYPCQAVDGGRVRGPGGSCGPRT